MTLQRLGSVPAALSWLAQRGVRGLSTDSRRLAAGDAFVAWPGPDRDGRQHVRAALASGARACVVEADGVEAHAFEHPDIATMPGLKAATGPLASAFYGAPSDGLSVVAVTGTNGKTSIAWWTAHALSALGRSCGIVGTLGAGIARVPGAQAQDAGGTALVPTGWTTPDPVTLHQTFRRLADEGCAACAVEASSIGLAEQRLSGTHIDVAVFSNFTQDHLDYHGSMEAYWQAKLGLFDWPGLRAAVVNVDDPRGLELHAALAGGALDLWSCSALASQGPGAPARLCARAIRYEDGGLVFDLVETGSAPVPLRTQLFGGYNVANLLAVVASLRALGVPLDDAARACAGLQPVPGRMQRVAPMPSPAQGSLPAVLVDYAHTPDALEQAMRAVLPLAEARGGVLWCVFGCGGNRDAGKRPLMGAIAQRLAQQVVITSDNPRRESAAAILADIAAGLAPGAGAVVRLIEDRHQAIAYAIRHASEGDVILIAGKGHETTQEIAGVRHPFNDVVEAAAALRARACAGEVPA